MLELFGFFGGTAPKGEYRVSAHYFASDRNRASARTKVYVRTFENWGTPNDLRTFEYWQSCFHKWAGHPYRLEQDARVPPEAVAGLESRYRATVPVIPPVD